MPTGEEEENPLTLKVVNKGATGDGAPGYLGKMGDMETKEENSPRTSGGARGRSSR